MIALRVSILVILAACFPAFYAEDFRIVDGKKCVVKKRARNVTVSPLQDSSSIATIVDNQEILSVSEAFAHNARPTPFREHIAQVVTDRKRGTRTFTTTATTATTTTSVAPLTVQDADEVDSAESDDTLEQTQKREPKIEKEQVTTRFPQRSFTSSLAKQTTTEDSKGQFMDVGDFDFDDSVAGNAVTAPPHNKRDFTGTAATDSTTPVSTSSTEKATTTSSSTSIKQKVTAQIVSNRIKSKDHPLIEPWVVVKSSGDSIVTTVRSSTSTSTTPLPSTLASTESTEDIDEKYTESEDTHESDIPEEITVGPTSTSSVKKNQKLVLTEQQRSRLIAAENHQAGLQGESTSTTVSSQDSLQTHSDEPLSTQASSTTTTTTTTTIRPTTQTSKTTHSTTDAPQTTNAPKTTLKKVTDQIVEKRQESQVSVDSQRKAGDARSIRVVDADGQQNVDSSQSLLSASQKGLQGTFTKIEPSVDKGVNTTGLQRVNGPDSPLLDGSYLSDPWMCRVKRDVVKSPIIMETCGGEKKEIVDLRVYKLVGIPTEECITTPVVLGDRCASLNGGKARCAQRYVRYGLIAKDLDSDKKGHECFRFPSACLCQLIVGDMSPLPVADSAGKI